MADVVNLSYLDKFLVSNVGGNALDGSYWGFCSIEDYEVLQKSVDNLDSLTNVNFTKLKSNSGVLIQVDKDHISSLLSGLNEGFFTSKDRDYAEAIWMTGVLEFKLFMKNKVNYEGFIGVNEISDATTVTVSGKTYPSFRVGVEYVREEFKDYDVTYFSHENKWVSFSDDVSSEDFYKSFTMSTTRNCMVLPIRVG